MKNNIYLATIINEPNGNNIPKIKFKNNNGEYIVLDCVIGLDSNKHVEWGKGQTIYIKYIDGKVNVINNSINKFELLLFIISFIISVSIFIISFFFINNDGLKFIICGLGFVIGIAIFIIGNILYSKVIKNKCNKKSIGKLIGYIPVLTHHQNNNDSTNGKHRCYISLEWRTLLEYKLDNGDIIRNIEFCDNNNSICTHIYSNEKVVPIDSEFNVIYEELNPFNAYIDNNIKYENYKVDKCSAKVIDIKQVKMNSIDNNELDNAFILNYLVCEYNINEIIYRETSKYPVLKELFNIGDEVDISYNINNYSEYTVMYIKYNEW